ncbi:MAG: outer membrane lipoprotein carrier protein LolA [Deltaproteobacteria bacterium]|nr:outer membrane lipoprotein carrier protein LolA [Deltaproteobacteria bacterium]
MIQKSFPLFFFFFFLLGWANPDPVAEIKTERKAGENKSQIFALISAGASKVQALSSDFSQERHLAMLKEPLISSGKFAYEKPDRLYWEIGKPSPMGFVVQGDQVRRWSGDSGVAESLEVNQDPMIRAIVEQVLAWTRADFPWLEKRYRITVMEEAPSSLKLIPLSAREKKFLAYITITFSEDWTHVRSVALHEKGRDFTRLRFMNTLLNPSLPKDLFVR